MKINTGTKNFSNITQLSVTGLLWVLTILTTMSQKPPKYKFFFFLHFT